ncbi:hypothetical protein LTR10_000747 [Elasticomyces elasticus]|nr:hypothetical protein LTR10_000747 [Elasticomyces elasticus]KAK4980008.1 hypothetical protein LTR42_000315 [Elasticomyces elasticus]
MEGDKVHQSWDAGYNEARALYDADKLEEAMEAADELLNTPGLQQVANAPASADKNAGLPRYHRIKCYLLIAASVNDWEEAEELLRRADINWQMARMYIGEQGPDPGGEAALGELRGAIDHVRVEHQKERPGSEEDKEDIIAEAAKRVEAEQEEAKREREQEFGEVVEDYEETDLNDQQDKQQEEAQAAHAKGSSTTSDVKALYHHRHKPIAYRPFVPPRSTKE